MTNTHHLETELHSEFLKQGRIDPITGEEIEEGHTIVICSACKSAFFIESWEYLGQTHCNQAETLSEIPKSKTLVLEAKPLDYLPFLFRKGLYFAKTGKEGTLQMWTYFAMVLLTMAGIGLITVLIGSYISEFLAVVFMIFLIVFISNHINKKEKDKISTPHPKETNYIGIDHKNQSLQIKRGNEKQNLPFSKIEQLEYSIDYVYPLCILTLEIMIANLSKKKLNYYANINHSDVSDWSNFLEELPYNLKVLQVLREESQL
ncbi:hypothetical protein ACE193_12835 [Bernardetia sp. OM2101]|uniref:hypothetical protein n=1 Tax=Bernardetia sp. OM2101 TaxID=3344876 RepID=UPI0035D0DECC